MAFNVNEMRSQLVYGGARQNLFQVRINNPANGSADLKTPFMVTTAQLPESTVGVIPVWYFGRPLKLAGDRQFADWTVTVLNDEDFLVRNALEEWSNRINRLERNVRDINRYKTSATVIQYSKDGTPIREYTFEGLFPQAIGGIDLDWSSTDAIEQFQVTFSYDYWTVTGGTTGDAGGR